MNHDISSSVFVLTESVAQLTEQTIQSCSEGREKELLLILLLAKCRVFHKATLILSRHGLADAADTCQRSLLEHSWVFHSLASPDTFSQAANLLRTEDKGSARKNIEGALRACHGNDESVTRSLRELLERYLNAGGKLDLVQWAALAKRKDEYERMYRPLSMRAHPILVSIEAYLGKKLNQTVKVELKPRGDDIDFYLLSANSIMLDMIERFPRLEKKVHGAQVSDLRLQLEALLKEVEGTESMTVGRSETPPQGD